LKHSKDLDGIILASAGLKRIELEKHIVQKFSLDEVVPSACQGLISVACLKSNNELCDLLSSKTHNLSDLSFRIERKFVETLSASCRSALGCFSQIISDSRIKITSIVLNQNKKIYKKIVLISEIENCLYEIEEVAKDLLKYLDK
jgi:porphobilinogen deaminase